MKNLKLIQAAGPQIEIEQMKHRELGQSRGRVLKLGMANRKLVTIRKADTAYLFGRGNESDFILWAGAVRKNLDIAALEKPAKFLGALEVLGDYEVF